MSTKVEKTWPMVAHLSAMISFLIPFGGVVGPLFVWFLKKDSDPETSYHARRAVNWQVTVLALTMLVFGGAFTIHKVGMKKMGTLLAQEEIAKKEGRLLTGEEGDKALAESAQGEKIVHLMPIFLSAGTLFVFFLNIAIVLLNSALAYQGKRLRYPPTIPVMRAGEAPAAS
jgi:uncharacterized Tic20 family protein